jgi:hypothetical protein
MKWTILPADVSDRDHTGVDGFIQRLDAEVRGEGQPLEGFKFVNSGMEMLHISREIEREALGAGNNPTLYVGFQRPEKLTLELERYRRLNQAGVRTVAFGHGSPDPEGEELTEQWVDLSHDVNKFENQWYLVLAEPNPIAFVGWETSIAMFGEGGISTPGKEFRGFVSTDPRVVVQVIAHLERVRRQHGPTGEMSFEQLSDEIPFPVNKILVLTDDGQKSELAALRESAAEFAAKKSASVLLYDLSAASYLVSPYPSEVYERDWDRALGKQELNMAGRAYLAGQLDELESSGVQAGAILPTGHGFKQLAEWAEQEKADLIIIPEFTARPGLIDRIKGYTLKILQNHTDIPIVLESTDGTVQLYTVRRGPKAPAIIPEPAVTNL